MLNFWDNIQTLLLEIICYVVGTFFFVSRYPEKAFPGKFDLWVGSY